MGNLIEQLGGYEKAKSIIDHAPKYAKGWFGGIYYKQGEWCWWWSEYLKKWLQDEKHTGHITRYTQSFKLCEVEKALLKYRHQHNTYEVGDLVIYKARFKGVWREGFGKITEIDEDLEVVNIDENVGVAISEIEHANDEEIKAGGRL